MEPVKVTARIRQTRPRPSDDDIEMLLKQRLYHGGFWSHREKFLSLSLLATGPLDEVDMADVEKAVSRLEGKKHVEVRTTLGIDYVALNGAKLVEILKSLGK